MADRTIDADPTIDALIATMEGEPVIVRSNGRAVAVLVDLERYRDLQAIYDWHERVLKERVAG